MAFIRVGDACQMRQSDTRMNVICIFSHDTTIQKVYYKMSQFPNMTQQFYNRGIYENGVLSLTYDHIVSKWRIIAHV